MQNDVRRLSMKPNKELSLEEFKRILIRQTELYEQEVNNADEIRNHMVTIWTIFYSKFPNRETQRGYII